MTTSSAPISLWLHVRQGRIEDGNVTALDEFWRDVSAQGVPLIEPHPDDAEHSLVTFLWHGDAATENVVIFGGLAIGWDVDNNKMSRLGDTDVWYKTYRARKDTRTTYQLSPNDPLPPPSEVTDWTARMAAFQPDPLNPKTFTFPKDPERNASIQFDVSILELPDAPPQPWITPRGGVPTGRVEQHRFRSDILDNERRLWVYTPPNYAARGEPCDLLILFDGDSYNGRLIPTPTILDNLAAGGHIRPLVALMIDSLDLETRHCELACRPQFLSCLAEELLPWVHHHYHVTTDPARTVVGGCSLGALMATYAGLQRPDLFGNVLSQSGAYWWGPQWSMAWSPESGADVEWEWLSRDIAINPRRPVRFYLEVGRLEIAIIRSDFPGQIAPNRHMRDVLEAKGYPVQYNEFSGGLDYVCWRGTVADGIVALLGLDQGA